MAACADSAVVPTADTLFTVQGFKLVSSINPKPWKTILKDLKMAMNAERMALFSGGGNRNTNSSKALVEFRAGKMSMNGTLVTPDKRKGLLAFFIRQM